MCKVIDQVSCAGHGFRSRCVVAGRFMKGPARQGLVLLRHQLQGFHTVQPHPMSAGGDARPHVKDFRPDSKDVCSQCG